MTRSGGLALWLALLGLALACMALAKQEDAAPNDGLPLVNADLQMCAPVRRAPPVPLDKARGIPINPRASELS